MPNITKRRCLARLQTFDARWVDPKMTDLALEARNISKRYGETQALKDVTLCLKNKGVTGLVGENGAGKSTLLNILSGLMAPDTGDVVFGNGISMPVGFAAAQKMGIGRVFQEQSLIGHVPVFENLLMGTDHLYARFGQFLSRRRMIAKAQDMVDQAGFSIDVRRMTRDLTFSQRQMIEIVRACLGPSMLFGVGSPIVLLDEPTASLERGDEVVFLNLLENLREEGSLLFVSHRLGEVLDLCDSVVVFKDGQRVAEVLPENVGERELHQLMVGRERDADYYHENRQKKSDSQGMDSIRFSARGLTRPGQYEDVDLRVAPGEVLGIGGLLESGKAALGQGLAGVERPASGEISFDGEFWLQPVASKLINMGVGYIPAERLTEGMIAEQPLAWNITLPSGDIFSNALGIWRHAEEIDVAREMIDGLKIKAGGPHVTCDSLSGGNQQKVVLARWLARDIKVLILDNPTRGVDAGAKEEIYSMIRDLTDTGVAIVLITDELLELIGLSNRIAIMRHGQITEIIPSPAHQKPTEQLLVAAMLSSREACEREAA